MKDSGRYSKSSRSWSNFTIEDKKPTMEKWSDEEMDDAIDGILEVVPSQEVVPGEKKDTKDSVRYF